MIAADTTPHEARRLLDGNDGFARRAVEAAQGDDDT
jgi:hypothetical protein